MNNDCNLIISRPGKFFGRAISVSVSVNGSTFPMKAGEEIDINLPVGINVIKYKVWCRREQEVTINVAQNKKYSLILVYDPLWGGFKVSKKSILN